LPPDFFFDDQGQWTDYGDTTYYRMNEFIVDDSTGKKNQHQGQHPAMDKTQA
jgi:hypothetical protein